MIASIKNKFVTALQESSKAEIIFWYAVRAMLLVGSVLAQTQKRRLFIAAALLFTFGITIVRCLFAKNSFFGSLSYRIQTLLCIAAFFGTVVGKCFGVLDIYPEYDVFLHLMAGFICVAIGYHIALALNKPTDKSGNFFTVFASFTISCTVAGIREIAEFIMDFELGTNFLHAEIVSDDHWFYQLFGRGMTDSIRWGGVLAQQRLYDTDEDMLLAIISSLAAVAILYVWLRIKNKEFYSAKEKEKKANRLSLGTVFAQKLRNEKEKMLNDCNVCDFVLWWSVRALMIYAAFNMVKAEAILLSVNLLGTFAVSLIHLIAPSSSVLSRLSYRVQSIVTVIVFLGSYCGNYIFLYGILPRYDLFLHFTSGAMSMAAGYYLSKAFFEITNKKQAFLSAIFALSFSGMIMPVHEIIEFIGDFLWGTDNQGFSWAPTSESFFFKVFGEGVGNTELYYVFDTMYDMLLAWSTALMGFAVLLVWLMVKTKKHKGRPEINEAEEKTVRVG
ncbi:MAG: hypothetical protein IKJ27_09350 [Clostridia bacterium]|nr:hypothetical protein [Clostridia bacterium]